MFESLKILRAVYCELLKNKTTRMSTIISLISTISVIVILLYGIITLQGLNFWISFGLIYAVISIISFFFWRSNRGKKIMKESWNIGWDISYKL